MSKYTTEVRFICEKYAGLDSSVGYADVNRIIDQSWNKIFDFSFPIFDEEYRSVLCKKILKHFYTREIAFETVGLWKLKLDTLMNEIMPFYNQLYESTLLDFDPLFDADYYKDHKGKDAGTGEETGERSGEGSNSNKHTGTVTDAGTHGGTVSDASGKAGERHDVGSEDLSETSWDVYSDTPQGALTNVDNNTYLTNARKVTHTSDRDTTDDSAYSEQGSNLRTYNETNGNTRTYNDKEDSDREYSESTNTERTYSNTDEFLDHIYGKTPGKSYMQLIKELRENILNIDMNIIADCGQLFIKLW